MRLAQRTLTRFGAVLLAAVVLSLIVPHAAHAVVATLVQLVNTAAAPAVTQDVSKLASQNVSFSSQLNDANPAPLISRGKDGVSGSAFTVPAGQTLILTSVNFTPDSASNFAPTVLLQDSSNLNSRYGVWWAPAGVTAAGGVSSQFTYPVGIAIQSGITPSLTVSQPGFLGIIGVDLQGYLTSN